MVFVIVWLFVKAMPWEIAYYCVTNLYKYLTLLLDGNGGFFPFLTHPLIMFVYLSLAQLLFLIYETYYSTLVEPKDHTGWENLQTNR